MGRELDVRVAEVLGLGVVGVGMAYPDPEVLDWWYPTSDGHSGNEMQPLFVAHCMCELRANDGIDEWTPDKMLGHYPGCLEVVPFYSTDHETARFMVRALTTPAQQSDYVYALSTIVTGGVFYPPQNWVWRMLAATPEQRCLAFLKAMVK